MRTLIVTEFVTLDGVMEAPGGEPSHPHTGWVGDFFSPELERNRFDEVLEAESLLVGRVTYESFAGAWPTYEGAFADRMNSMRKDVVTSTLAELGWTNSHRLDTGAGLSAAVAALKAGDGGPIVVTGSRTLVHALHVHDLVDEWRLIVFPVVLGSGFRVFADTPDKTELALAATEALPNGVVASTYRRVTTSG